MTDEAIPLLPNKRIASFSALGGELAMTIESPSARLKTSLYEIDHLNTK
ncbi:MAG TPA: hypothetical protein VMT04_03520 [Terriglobales bacterium]|nr:hypothetical protein [Terriglobales bacterium]